MTHQPLAVIESVGAADADAQWQGAWRLIAEACETGLTGLDPLHPRRADLLALTRDARLASRLPASPQLRTA